MPQQSGPWEDYAQHGPWEDFATKPAAAAPAKPLDILPNPKFPLQPQPVPASARFAGGLGEGLQGLLSPILHPVDTVKSLATELDPGTEMRRVSEALQNPEHRTVGGVAAAALPIVGPTVQKLADQYRSGDTAGVAGNLTALGAAGLAPEIAPKAGDVVNAAARGGAERLMESALKPAPRANSLADIRSMVNTALDQGIPPSAGGFKKLDRLVSDIGAQKQATIATNPEAPLSPSSIASRTNPTIADFRNRDLQKDLTAAQAEKARFLSEHSTPVQYSPYGPTQVSTMPPDVGTYQKETIPRVQTYQREVPIPAERAQAMKEGIWQELAEPDFGQKASGYKETRKQLGRGLKEDLESIFPNLKGLNQQQGELLQLRPELEAAVNRNANRNLLGFSTPLVGAGMDLATGSAPAAVGTMLGKELFTPANKGRLAIALSRAAR